MRDLLERAGRRGHHSLAAALVADGTPAYEGWSAAGAPPDADTVFEIGSITKAFTGVLLADMHLRGEANLDDPLSHHLDRPAPSWRAREPTLLELATHRSGAAQHPGPARPQAHAPSPRARRQAALLEHRLRPARRRARGRGKPYDELLRERILAPLGMDGTTSTPGAPAVQGHSRRGRPRPPLEDLMPAAGSLRSNVEDMAAWLQACLAPGPDPPARRSPSRSGPRIA